MVEPTRWAVFRATAVYCVSRVINGAIPFLLLPIMTRYLTPFDYGVLSMFGVLVAVALPLVTLSLHGAVGVRYFDGDRAGLPNYVGNCFLVVLVATAGLSAMLWLFRGPVASLIGFPPSWLWAVTVVAAAQFAVLLVMTHWQVQGRAFPFGVFQILQTVVNLGLSVWLVVSWGHGWRGRVEAQVVTALAFAGAGMVVLARDGWLRYSYSRQDVREAIRFGLPLVPHELGSTLIAQTDRLFIANIVSLADAGVYSVAYQLTSIIELVAASFNQAFSPWLFRMLAQRPSLELLRVIVKYTYVCFAVMAGFALTVALLLPYVLSHVVGDAFAGAARFTPWLAIGFMFSGMYYLVANYIFFAKRTELIPLITVSCALVNLGLNAVLVPRNGAVGAAQASAAALALSFVGTWYLSTRAYKMPWSLKRC